MAKKQASSKQTKKDDDQANPSFTGDGLTGAGNANDAHNGGDGDAAPSEKEVKPRARTKSDANKKQDNNFVGIDKMLEKGMIGRGLQVYTSDAVRLANKMLSRGSEQGSYERTVSQQGKFTSGRRLSMVIEAQLSEDVIMPFGNLNGLVPAAESVISTYLNLIAMRYKSIATDDWSAVPLHILDPDSKENSTPASEKTIQELKDAYSNSARKYMEQSVISPLLRRTLVDRSGVSTLSPGNILPRARAYASWKNKVSTPIIRQLLITDVVSHLEKDKVMESFTVFIGAMATGVRQQASIALPLLMNAVRADVNDKGNSDDSFSNKFVHQVSSGQEDGFVVEIPSAAVSYSVSAYDTEGRPWIVEKEIQPRLPRISNHDIAGLIRLYAELSGVNVTDTLSLETITRYSDLSVLVMEGNTDMSPEFASWFQDYYDTQFIIDVTQLRPVDTSVASIFDEPNRSDLHGNMADKLYFYALSLKVMIKCLSNVMGALIGSVDVEGDAIADILKQAGLTLQSSMPVNTYALVQRATSSNASMMISGRSIVENAFYMDPEIAPKLPIYGSVLRTLKKFKALNPLISTLERTDSFYASSPGMCCLVVNASMLPLLSRIPGKLAIKQREEFDEETIEAGFINFISNNENATEQAFAFMYECSPVVLTNMVLDGVDKFSFRTSDVELDSYDIREIYHVTIGKGIYHVWITDEIFASVEGEKAVFDTEIGFVTKSLGIDIQDFIKVWSFKTGEDNN